MIPDIGNYALILALAVSVCLGTIPLLGAARNNPGWMQFAYTGTWVQFLLLTIAIICLGISFVNDDFSVKYVALHSNSALPLIYKISAIWGGHEGSLLLWVFLLSLWAVLVTIFSRSLPDVLNARALAVLALVTIGFLLFLILTSNPFERLFPPATDGRDLNPLLQDPGLAIHPPMLYMGYVGFAVPFAFVVAALIGGKLDSTWARWSRPWTAIAWVFLTIGISLGSWWAYYELGWGGWWFWDPVENASFMPWLMGTALLHTMAVAEKRGAFKSWTVLLAIFTFSFSLLGTFLVRSGVLVSVHAFATDPERGIFILIFLGLVLGLSLGLYALRVQNIYQGGAFRGFSRETFLLINNVLLVVACLTVLIGTLYPLILDALGLGKLSVGPPYFNTVFIPLMLPMTVLIGFGAMSRWKHDSFTRILAKYKILLPVSIVFGAIVPWLIFDSKSVGVGIATAIALWVIASALYEPFARGAGFNLKRFKSLSASHYGMMLAHIGVGIFIIGVAFSSAFSVEKDVKMQNGTKVNIGNFSFTMHDLSNIKEPNYVSTSTEIKVHNINSGEFITSLHPEKRIYSVQSMPMTEAAIDGSLFRDLYVAMGEPVDETGRAWAMRVYYKPFVRWIWLGTIFMAVGGLLAAFDKRYRLAGRRARERFKLKQA